MGNRALKRVGTNRMVSRRNPATGGLRAVVSNAACRERCCKPVACVCPQQGTCGGCVTSLLVEYVDVIIRANPSGDRWSLNGNVTVARATDNCIWSISSPALQWQPLDGGNPINIMSINLQCQTDPPCGVHAWRVFTWIGDNIMNPAAIRHWTEAFEPDCACYPLAAQGGCAVDISQNLPNWAVHDPGTVTVS